MQSNQDEFVFEKFTDYTGLMHQQYDAPDVVAICKNATRKTVLDIVINRDNGNGIKVTPKTDDVNQKAVGFVVYEHSLSNSDLKFVDGEFNKILKKGKNELLKAYDGTNFDAVVPKDLETNDLGTKSILKISGLCVHKDYPQLKTRLLSQVVDAISDKNIAGIQNIVGIQIYRPNDNYTLKNLKADLAFADKYFKKAAAIKFVKNTDPATAKGIFFYDTIENVKSELSKNNVEATVVAPKPTMQETQVDDNESLDTNATPMIEDGGFDDDVFQTAMPASAEAPASAGATTSPKTPAPAKSSTRQSGKTVPKRSGGKTAATAKRKLAKSRSSKARSGKAAAAVSGSRKRKRIQHYCGGRQRTDTFLSSISKARKDFHPEHSMSVQAACAVDSLLHQMMGQMLDKAAELNRHAHKKTLQMRDLQMAARLLYSKASQEKANFVNLMHSDFGKMFKLDNKAKKYVADPKGKMFFVPGRVGRLMRKISKSPRISHDAILYMTSSLNYAAAEILQSSYDVVKAFKSKRLTTRLLACAIRSDTELDQMFPGDFMGARTIPLLSSTSGARACIKPKSQKK